ncbi:MAG: propionyl-CoA synthetase [Thermoplasmata archaeon]|nr:propionyl-CoA synthetase [Thermoplasmata archaeon]
MDYDEAFRASIDEPETFWAEAAEAIDWHRRWDRVLDFDDPPFYRWFIGAEMNTCHNALDRHVADGRADQVALIHDSPVTGMRVTRYTYGELLDLVSRFAGVLKGQGVGKGDTVIIYMPMVPEALVAMLACARIGAIHSVVFGGFAPRELALRIDDAAPKVIITASCGIEGKKVIPYRPLLDEALGMSRAKPDRIILFQRPEVEAPLDGIYLDWAELMADAEPAPCEIVKATDPLYILYTSGTTGMPKGVVRDNGGHAVALAWTMRHIYGIEPGDIWWTASDVGWVVGHSYIVYAPLLIGATTVMYEGKPIGTPDAGAFWRVISQHGVKVMFTAPTAFRAIKREDPDGLFLKGYDISRFEALFLAGERTDPDTYFWATELLGVPVYDHWWQTETAWAITANFRDLTTFKVKPGSATKPSPGYDLRVLDASGRELGENEEGVLVVRLPLPPGCFTGLWRNEKRFRESYMEPFPGYYFTGDGGYIDHDGYVFVMGRVDDVINVAGHRLSTGAMEEVISNHPDIAECAVVGANDDLKGQVPIGLVVLKKGATTPHEEIVRDLVRRIRGDIGAIACFRQAAIVDRLPKTRSGKVLRGTIRKIADGHDYRVPSTIEDPEVLKEVEKAVGTIGYGKKE